MKLVLVKWVDSHAGRGWQTPDRLEQIAEPLFCQSVGWLVKENREVKIIAPHIAGERHGDAMLQYSGDMTIPVKSIVSVTIIRDV